MPITCSSFNEVLPLGKPCHFYVDMEFTKCYYAQLSGKECMKILRKIILAEIYVLVTEWVPEELPMAETLRLIRGCFCELESSCDEKFSRHIIVQMPFNLVFASSEDCGYFVH